MLIFVFQGQCSSLQHLVPANIPANIQIIRSGAPQLQIGPPVVPPQTFTSHLPRGLQGELVGVFGMKTSVTSVFSCRGRCSSRDVQHQNCPETPGAAHHPPGNLKMVLLGFVGGAGSETVEVTASCLCSQSRPAVTTSTAVLPNVVAPISATRTQSPVISPTVTHSAEVPHG